MMMDLTGRTGVVGVAGWPVGHSCSPIIHNYWLKRYNIDAVYVPFPVHEGKLETAIRGFQASGLIGINVTAPHKMDAFRLADTADPSVVQIGSANTLVFSLERKVEAYNTDGAGFVSSLKQYNFSFRKSSKVLVLGAGGAARGICHALLKEHIDVYLTNRSLERADQLSFDLPEIHLVPWRNRHDFLIQVDLLVNATSAGLGNSISDNLCDFRAAKHSLVVADIVYHPVLTAFLAQASIHGLRTINGLHMLLHQARIGFQLWFGIEPEITSTLYNRLLSTLE